MQEYDDWHYNFRRLDGYNASVNFSLSCRGTGRTSALWRKSFGRFSADGLKTIVQIRQENYINEGLMNSIHGVISKFSECPAFEYKKTELGKSPVVKVSCGGKPYLTILAMNAPITALKGIFEDNVAFWIGDEFICNERMGERYAKNEAFKFKEAWTTFFRESHQMKAYFCGNPYSAYNPYFSEFGVNPKDLRLGAVVSGGGVDDAHPQWACERYLPNDRLMAELRKNPMMAKELDEYTRYALLGEAVNDTNIFISERAPKDSFLRFFFKIDGKYLGVWENPRYGESPSYWCGLSSEAGKRRDVYCFDFKDLSERAVLFSHDEHQRFGSFRMAVRNRNVAFESIECDYLVEEIYPTL